MTYKINKRNLTIEETIEWLGGMGKSDVISLEDAHELSKMIKKLYEDNRMIYEGESEYSRDD